MTTYGTAQRDYRQAAFIGDVFSTPSGNVAMRIGRLIINRPEWEQIAHVVLTPDDALALAEVLHNLATQRFAEEDEAINEQNAGGPN